ncbi:MAG TPA: NAD(P)/FAD-dependent oxidoreductase [Bacteroidales bacterium]|nr:NAD(P)/FAD-dependent oxidoreductase [Bacteroidales bacterium]HPS26833.1 NAD(P)/FAD-dependent oxidoreductase [Bacteroidales bacterium]
MYYDVIVVGGGASGLMCAGIAAGRGLSVLLLEKMALPARKLRISGKGRCNLTNILPKERFMEHIGPDARFLHNAFGVFFAQELIDFFEGLGVKTLVEQGGRVFPESGKAIEVVDVLTAWVKKSGVIINSNAPVVKIITDNDIAGGVVTAAKKQYAAGAVVVATGGLSYPATGSTGDGYRFARLAGHTVFPLRPMLVPLISSDFFISELNGLHLKNICITVAVDGTKKYSIFGEMEFRDNTLAGPVILSLSRKFIDEIIAGKKVVFYFDLKPGLDQEKLNARLLRDLNTLGKAGYHELLRGLLPGQLIPVFQKLLAVDGAKKCSQITADERKLLVSLLKEFPVNINAHRDYNEAIITGGGVSTKEVNPKTLESKIVKNLFFTGEVLNLDADTGGYNLQIAFSTGYLAGISIQKKE